MKAKLLLIGLSLAIVISAHAGSASWNLNPTTGDWNTAAHWTPATVPNSPTDIATFSISNTPDIVIHSSVELEALVYATTAASFIITLGDAGGLNVVNLIVSGRGIMNDDTNGILENIYIGPNLIANGAKNTLSFRNNATVSEKTTLLLTHLLALGGQSSDFGGGAIEFHSNSSAGLATLINFQGSNDGGPGQTTFFDVSSAGESSINNSAFKAGSVPGCTNFTANSTAGNSVIVSSGSLDAIADGGHTTFLDSSTAGDAVLQANGTLFAGENGGGMVVFTDNSTAENVALSGIGFSNGGTDSGSFHFEADSTGGTARVIGSGNLVIENHNPPGLTIGSLDGSGSVFLGSNGLSVGSNNLSTTFAGVIQGTGSLIKIGTGVLTLTGNNSHSGGTTVRRGRLIVNNVEGSGTGSGAVRVNAGVLAGRGVIAGDITLGTGGGAGAALAPGKSPGKTGTLTIQKTLTFQLDSAYNFELRTTTGNADRVAAKGVTINNGALFAFSGLGSSALTPGTIFTAIDNTATTPITGTFANLADGSTFAVGSNTFQASYEGGDGNDLTLTVVP